MTYSNTIQSQVESSSPPNPVVTNPSIITLDLNTLGQIVNNVVAQYMQTLASQAPVQWGAPMPNLTSEAVAQYMQTLPSQAASVQTNAPVLPFSTGAFLSSDMLAPGSLQVFNPATPDDFSYDFLLDILQNT